MFWARGGKISHFVRFLGPFSTLCQCSSSRVNHAVTATGFGQTNGQNTLTVKNSWGRNWGVNGFVYFQRDGQHNTCAAYSEGQYAVL